MRKFILLSALVFCFQTTYSQYAIVGTGSGVSVFSPIDRHNDYSVYEIVYAQSDINMAGSITGFDIQRVDGDNTDSIENVKLYMKHSTATTLSNANFDTTGYTRVFTGSFPNDAGSGWRGVQLDTPFVYNNTSNLQVIILKDYQPAIANTPVTPRWYYTNISPSRARRYYGSAPVTSATPLTSLTYSSNARLGFNSVSVVEIGAGSKFAVYPNPSSDRFNIVCPANMKQANISIRNLLGALVYEKSVSANEMFTTPDFSSGLYILQVTGLEGNQIYTTRLIVE